MKKALKSLLLACLMASCQSHESRIPLFEARHDQPISVTVRTRDEAELKLWENCHRRDVGFVVKNSHGQSMPRTLVCIFWADTSELERARHDATEIKVLVQKEKETDAFLIGKHDAIMLGQRIEKPGTYLLEFYVHCYDRKHRLLYSGKTRKIRVHMADRTFLEGRTSREASEITLWVHSSGKL
ncbi:hypothetical protein [Prosthecobacter sp.]|uniref:hypothetical protein n=1 Tax=Prosthecobacter sp. TaxID=1965333 RepID=UPI003783014C